MMVKLIQTKRCSRCKQFKAISKFNRNKSRKDGLQHSCNSCRKIYAQGERGRLSIKKARKRYNQTKKGKINACKKMERYKALYPERRKAKAAVNSAITNGKFPRPNTFQCRYCPVQAEQYHHPSYAKKHRFKVVPVCRKCHIELHKGELKMLETMTLRQKVGRKERIAMKCPLSLPLKTFYGKMSSSWLVEDATGLVLIHTDSEEEADYIVQAINSYEKYKDYERLWELADKDNCDGDCDLEPPHKRCAECLARSALNDLGEMRGQLIDEIEQALKEAEKPK